MSKIYVGLDNGTTATIGIVGDNIEPKTFKVPVKKEQNYHKNKKNITRLDASKFMEIFSEYNKNDVVLVMERPMVNNLRLTSSFCALRCFEAELVIIEMLGIKHMFIDSKEWQKVMLPKGCSGDELKKASLDIGNRLFPQFEGLKHPDRDGILIAEYARRKNL